MATLTGSEPISAANLKAALDALRNELGGGVTVLFADTSGSGSVRATLSESALDFDLLAIGVQADGGVGSALVTRKTAQSLMSSRGYVRVPSLSSIRSEYINVYFESETSIRASDGSMSSVVGIGRVAGP